MKASEIKDITVESVRERHSGGLFIDNDLALVDDISALTFPDGPRRVRCLILALCVKGSATYNLDTIGRRVSAGDIIIINSGQVIDDYAQSDGSEGVGLVIADRFFYEIISGVRNLAYLFTFSRMHPVFRLTEEEMRNTLSYIAIIKQKMAATTHRFRRDIVRSLFQALIYDTGETIARIRQVLGMRNPRAETIYVDFMHSVEREFRHERRVGWYAAQLGITTKYLSETVKAVSRRTPNEWIDNFVVLELRVLLKSTTMTVKEIAELMHFPNQSFLGRYFKEHVGMGPTAFRRQ